MTIHVVGGVYREYCERPRWKEVYGSAGRAAIAIATLGSPVRLHAYFDSLALEVFTEFSAWKPSLKLQPTVVANGVGFDYFHDMATPNVTGRPAVPHPPIRVQAEKVVRFGMLEGTAIVDAKWAVYDPQNQNSAEPFDANGSKAEHLALVLNSWEAATMAGMPGQAPVVTAPALAKTHGAEVVVVKMGPEGAYVWTAGSAVQVPAFQTPNVWKIGSGDCFVAHFAKAWMDDGLNPAAAALVASTATAFYCNGRVLPTSAEIAACAFPPVTVSSSYASGTRPQVYLAGPFFDLSQVWMVFEARNHLQGFGLNVFSPYHDVGPGDVKDGVVDEDIQGIKDSDFLFAVADGLDAGTIYEIGYARALGKPVIVYSERGSEEDLKMMAGSDCRICRNFTTAMYTALWEAAAI